MGGTLPSASRVSFSRVTASRAACSGGAATWLSGIATLMRIATSVHDATEKHHRREDGVGRGRVVGQRNDEANEHAGFSRLGREASTEGVRIADELRIPAVDLGLLEIRAHEELREQTPRGARAGAHD